MKGDGRIATRWHCCVVDSIQPFSILILTLLPFSRSVFLPHVVSSSPTLHFPSIHLFYTLPCSLFPPSLSTCAQHVWWSWLYSWELNTQNCSVPSMEARCLRKTRKAYSRRAFVCLIDWHWHKHTQAHAFLPNAPKTELDMSLFFFARKVKTRGLHN